MDGKLLPPKQQRFVTEYLVDLNATQAAIRAGYSAKNADKIGSQLLGKTRVAAAIGKAMENRAQRTEITADYVLRRLKEESDKEGEGTSHAARIRALELLGKHLKMFTDVQELRGAVQLEVVEEIISADSEKDHPPAPGPA